MGEERMSGEAMARASEAMSSGGNTARSAEKGGQADESAARASDGQTALAIEGLSVIYRSSRGPHKAVDNAHMTVRPGEFVSILGPSGCGKSTLLSVVAGLLTPSQGTVSIFGERAKGPRSDVGVVFQQATLLPWTTVTENVLIPIKALRRNDRDYAQRARELLDLVGLSAFAHHYPGELSGGMQQRVGIARALIHDPKLLLMDEPFAALDAMTRERMAFELQDIWLASGKSVLFITHSISEAVFLSDRVLVMSASPGRVINEVVIDLPRPRSVETMSSSAYAAICGEIRKMFIH
jgi:NitT/TauT family transport system ATP-binding protein